MKRRLVTDELWKRAEPLIPKPPPDPRGGRPRADDRLCLAGIVFVLKTGIQWGELPGELGVSGSTCWRRLRDWKEAGVWDRLLEELLAELNAHGRLDLSLAVVDSASVRALKGGERPGPNPTDRGKNGSTHHTHDQDGTDRNGVPIVVETTAANVNDGTRLIDLVDAIPPIRGRVGAPRRRPRAVVADKAYHSRERVVSLWIRGIEPRLPERGKPDGRGLGKVRWVVERTLSWLHQFRRLRTRWERRSDIHQAFLTLAAAIICLGKLPGVGF
ncbi:MAG: IS5 family transposase [Phycisphaerales bacterium]|nr:IS5 family transposase [Phycisphaerales bacterium]